MRAAAPPPARPPAPRVPPPAVVRASPSATATRLRPPLVSVPAKTIPPRAAESLRAELAPRPTRKGTPLLLVLGSAALMIGLLVALTSRPSGAPARPAPSTAAPPATTVPAPTATPAPAGPLAAADPDVRAAVEGVLAAYARALESQDAALLAQARPDLTAAERERLLAPFRGAVNVATDLRVLDVIPSRGLVVVPVLRTDVIIGGRGAPTAPVEETFRFERRDGAWRLAAGAR
jgi:hypothetical protein